MPDPEIKIYAQAGLGFFVSYVDPFTKRRIKRRIGDRVEAEKYGEEIRRELTQAISSNPREMLVQDLMRIHLRDRPKTTLSRSEVVLPDFLDSFGTLKLKELTTDVLRSWIERLKIERNYKESTLHGIKVTINIFFRDLVRREVLEVSPIEGIHYKRRLLEEIRKPIILLEDQLRDLLIKAEAYSPGHFYPLFLAFVETGAKSSEILELKWDAVNFKAGTITFPGDKTLTARTLPISKELHACLSRMRPVSEYVFTSLYNEKMTKRKLSSSIKDFKAHYGITDKWMYFDLRHSFAHNFLARGGNLKRLKDLLGVRSLQTAEVVYGPKRPKELDVVSPFEG